MQYVVLVSQGSGIPGGFGPDAPSVDNTADGLAEARRVFARQVRDLGRDGIATADGGPWADLYPADNWDGISYGDAMVARLSVGPRGGVLTENC